MIKKSDLSKLKNQYTQLRKRGLIKNPLPNFLSASDKERLIDVAFLAQTYHGGQFSGLYKLSCGRFEKLTDSIILNAAREFEAYKKNAEALEAAKFLRKIASKWENQPTMTRNPKATSAEDLRDALESEAKKRKIDCTIEVPEKRYGEDALSVVQNGKTLAVIALHSTGIRWNFKNLIAGDVHSFPNESDNKREVAAATFDMIEKTKAPGFKLKYKGFSLFSNPSTYYFELSTDEAKLIAKKGFDNYRPGWYVCHQNKCYGPFSKTKAVALFDHASKTGKFPDASKAELVSQLTQNPEDKMSDKTQAQIRRERLKNLEKARAVRQANLRKNPERHSVKEDKENLIFRILKAKWSPVETPTVNNLNKILDADKQLKKLVNLNEDLSTVYKKFPDLFKSKILSSKDIKEIKELIAIIQKRANERVGDLKDMRKIIIKELRKKN